MSLFTDWQNHRLTQVWIKSRVEQETSSQLAPEFFGAKLATKKLHPLQGHAAENYTEQMGIPGPWYERLPHFRMSFTPSSGAEWQSEYFVPRNRGYEAILAVEQLRDHVNPHLLISELRTIDADNLWMSPCYQQPSMAIHFTWKPERTAVRKVLPMIEEKLAPFNARPHWGKLFTMSPSRLKSLYGRLPDYQALLRRYDPRGKFRNDFLNTNIYDGQERSQVSVTRGIAALRAQGQSWSAIRREMGLGEGTAQRAFYSLPKVPAILSQLIRRSAEAISTGAERVSATGNPSR